MKINVIWLNRLINICKELLNPSINEKKKKKKKKPTNNVFWVCHRSVNGKNSLAALKVDQQITSIYSFSNEVKPVDINNYYNDDLKTR